MLQGPNVDLLRAVCARTDRAGRRLRRHLDPGRPARARRAGRRRRRGRRSSAPRSTPGRSASSRRPGGGRAPTARPMSLAVRVIPCLDVARRPGGQGRQLRRPARRRRPGRDGPGLRRRGRRRAVLPRHHRLARTPARRPTTWCRRTAEQVFIPLTVGGGVRSAADVERLLRAGADKVAMVTAAVERPAGDRRDRRPVRLAGAGAVSIDARRSAGAAERLRGHHPRRAALGRPRPAGVGRARLRARGRRDPAQLDGRRRHQGAASTWRCWPPCARSARCRWSPAAAPGAVEHFAPGGRRRRRRGARRERLPLRRAAHR